MMNLYEEIMLNHSDRANNTPIIETLALLQFKTAARQERYVKDHWKSLRVERIECLRNLINKK
jgi:hypothetical protein